MPVTAVSFVPVSVTVLPPEVEPAWRDIEVTVMLLGATATTTVLLVNPADTTFNWKLAGTKSSVLVVLAEVAGLAPAGGGTESPCPKTGTSNSTVVGVMMPTKRDWSRPG